MNDTVRFISLFWMLLCFPAWPEEIPEDARVRLEKAERDLGVSEAAARQVRRRMEDLKADPASTRDQIDAMEAYVYEVESMVKARRETVEDLRELARKPLDAPDPEVVEGMEAFESAVGGLPSGEDPESEQERLDREFEASLEKFDAVILEHHRSLDELMAARMARGEKEAGSHGSAAAEAAELLRSMGVDPGGTGGESGEGTDEGTEMAGAEGAAGGEETEGAGGEQTASASSETGEGAQAGGQGGPGRGSSRPPRQDEDIVARQLREAAEKETDPVLREKLWKEYEAYLDGRS